jgi:hypothetical protein
MDDNLIAGHARDGSRHWEKRTEDGWRDFRFNQPYESGLKILREVLSNTNLDPATLWQWGTMQAMALIEILKAAERVFGREGQEMVLDCLRRVGYDIGKQITENTAIPDTMSSSEWMSFFATVVNRIVYSSLESPRIVDDQSVDFHIDWCPHQSHYSAFYCRVQRYFVQGMIDAAQEFLKKQGREEVWDVEFKTTIPAGADTCHFVIQKGSPEERRKWEEYTRELERKALRIAEKNSL